MAQTMCEKIMTKYSGDHVSPGDYVEIQPEWVLFCDMQWHHTIQRVLEDIQPEKLCNPERIVVIPDHRIPANNPFHANNQKSIREFVNKYGIKHFFDVGRSGIRNEVMLEQGFFYPGSFILSDEPNITSTGGMVGALGFGDSAKIAEVLCIGKTWFKVPNTMKVELNGRLQPGVQTRDVSLFLSRKLGQDGGKGMVVEYTGDLISTLSLDELNSLAQQPPLTVGALTSLIEPTEEVLKYLKGRARSDFEVVRSDSDCSYEDVYEFDVTDLEPQVSPPPESSTATPVRELSGLQVNQAYIGSCSGGRLEDLRIAAKLLEGRSIHRDTRLIITPISQEVLRRATEENLINVLLNAGVQIAAPSCGACPGGHSGVLANDEVCITTNSRNYPGRMGSDKAKIYLGSSYTVVASAIKGHLVDPRDIL